MGQKILRLALPAQDDMDNARTPGAKAPGVPHSSFLAISDQGLTTVILMVAYLPEPSVAEALMVAVPLRLAVMLPSLST